MLDCFAHIFWHIVGRNHKVGEFDMNLPLSYRHIYRKRGKLEKANIPLINRFLFQHLAWNADKPHVQTGSISYLPYCPCVLE